MFDNIGSKIKDVAVVLTFLGIIISFFFRYWCYDCG